MLETLYLQGDSSINHTLIDPAKKHRKLDTVNEISRTLLFSLHQRPADSVNHDLLARPRVGFQCAVLDCGGSLCIAVHATLFGYRNPEAMKTLESSSTLAMTSWQVKWTNAAGMESGLARSTSKHYLYAPVNKQTQVFEDLKSQQLGLHHQHQ